MAVNGTRTIDMDPIVLVDTLVGNLAGSSGQIHIEDVAQQIRSLPAFYERTKFDNPAALFANTTLTYTADQPDTVTAGDKVKTLDGNIFVVLPTGVSGQETTVGGIGLNEAGPDFTTVSRFKTAIAVADNYLKGSLVTAGGQVYIKDGGSGVAGLPGWSISYTDQKLGILDGAIHPATLTSVADAVLIDLFANKYNPDVLDAGWSSDAAPAIINPADQTMRLRNDLTGVLTSQAASLSTFWVTKKQRVEPSTEYTVSMHSAPQFSYMHLNNYIQFYNLDGSFHSSLSGVVGTPAAQPREVTFTTPAADVLVAFNLRNVTDFDLDNPVTAEHVEIVDRAMMINKGATAVPFVPYASGIPETVAFDAAAPELSLTKQGDFVYIRSACQQDPARDMVRRMMVGAGGANTTVDFVGMRFIPKTTAITATISAFNQSADVYQHGSDERTPIKINSMFLGAGHGAISYKVTKAAHGMDAVDVGSVWSDGTDQWVLTRVLDADTIMFTRENTGTATHWIISSAAPSGSTFTHVSGATTTGDITFTAPEQDQLFPVIRNYFYEIKHKGEVVTVDGVYTGSATDFVIRERYELLNIASQQNNLKAAVGAAVPDYMAGDIDAQVYFYNEWLFNKYGARTGRHSLYAAQGYKRTAGLMGDYCGFMQTQRLSLPGDSVAGASTTLHIYVPNIPAPVGGYDLQGVADITANAVSVFVNTSDWADSLSPPTHYCQFGKDGSGNTMIGVLGAYNPEVGNGIPAVRATKSATALYFPPSEKVYMVGVDATAGDAVAGEMLEMTTFEVPFAATDHDLTIPAVIATEGGSTYCYIASHQSLSGKLADVPPEFNGAAVSVIEPHSNFALDQDTVVDGKLKFTVTGGYADVILKIGS